MTKKLLPDDNKTHIYIVVRQLEEAQRIQQVKQKTFEQKFIISKKNVPLHLKKKA